MKKLLSKIEWPNLLFIVSTPLLAVMGSYWLFKNNQVHPLSWVLFAFMMIATGLGITAGYHRLFSHRSYRAHWTIKLFLLLFGGAAFEGSAREWCSAHRKHHRFVDTEKDPYNIKRGFWYAHVGWVILKADQSDESDVKDLLKDKLVLWQDKYYIPVSALVSFVFPMAVSGLWNDPWSGLILAGLVRLVLNHHFTFFINSWCHVFGSQNYSNQNTAKDSWFISLFTYGEGYHNFHHAFEHDYRNGIRTLDWDPTKWFIYGLSQVGLTSHLIRMPSKRILELKMIKREEEIKHKFFGRELPQWDSQQALLKARSQVLFVLQKIDDLKIEYHRAKKERMNELEVKLSHIKQEIQRHKKEFRQNYMHYQQILAQLSLHTAY